MSTILRQKIQSLNIISTLSKNINEWHQKFIIQTQPLFNQNQKQYQYYQPKNNNDPVLHVNIIQLLKKLTYFWNQKKDFQLQFNKLVKKIQSTNKNLLFTPLQFQLVDDQLELTGYINMQNIFIESYPNIDIVSDFQCSIPLVKFSSADISLSNYQLEDLLLPEPILLTNLILIAKSEIVKTNNVNIIQYSSL